MTEKHKTHHELEEISPDKTKRFLLLLAAILMFTIIGGIYVRSTDRVDAPLSPTPSFFPKNATEKIPPDWTLPTATSCQVAFPLPPQKEPYYFPYNPQTMDFPESEIGSGRYWHFAEKPAAGILLFRNTIDATFKNNSEQADYISAQVEVLCSPNQFHFTTDGLLTEIQQILSVEQASDAVKIVATKNENHWNRSVNVVNFTNRTFDAKDNYYIFAVKDYIYMVSKKVKSPNQSVKDAAQKIFDNLQFPKE
jgi:hypothetical protein